MNLNQLKKRLPEDFSKHCDRDLSIFTCSIFGETCTKTLDELFGLKYKQQLWNVRNRNAANFYRSEEDHLKFREGIGKMAKEITFAKLLYLKLKEYTNWINCFLKENLCLESFIPKLNLFINNYREFFAYHQAVYWAGDYLVEMHPELEENLKLLKEIYAYNEKVVPDVESYLRNIGVDYLTYKEAKKVLKNVGLFFFNEEETTIYYDDEMEELESFIKEKSPNSVDLSEVSGVIANKGKITGQVQVIDHPNKLEKVKEGAILITTMTRPQFNHILRNCKAIVCNEGNILSHAAILTRESNIPCIVGTKIATEIFKDGDEVEVDANNGIVRKLS